jgi:pilus assembly protein CpaB
VKKSRFFSLVLVLVLAVGAGYLNYQWVNGKISGLGMRADATEIETLTVIVAAQDLPVGTKLGPEMLKPAKYLPESVPPNHYAEPAKLENRVLMAAVSANEPILESRLAPSDVTVGGVQAMITPGKRAVAVKGNEVMGLSGFVAPGNRVDILVTMRSNGKEDEPTTKLVLESVPVLATGTVLEQSKDGSGTSPVDVYTLELTPEESELLALAANMGTLHFAMRNLQDKEPVLTRGADVRRALTSLTPERPKAAPKAKPRPVTFVEVISGSSSKKLEF